MNTCVNCGCVRENASINCSICGSKSVVLRKCSTIGTDYKQFEVSEDIKTEIEGLKKSVEYLNQKIAKLERMIS